MTSGTKTAYRQILDHMQGMASGELLVPRDEVRIFHKTCHDLACGLGSESQVAVWLSFVDPAKARQFTNAISDTAATAAVIERDIKTAADFPALKRALEAMKGKLQQAASILESARRKAGVWHEKAKATRDQLKAPIQLMAKYNLSAPGAERAKAALASLSGIMLKLDRILLRIEDAASQRAEVDSYLARGKEEAEILKRYDRDAVAAETRRKAEEERRRLEEENRRKEEERRMAEATWCFVATATYGNCDHSNVLLLRKWRDDYLRQTAAGRAFISCYYKVGPGLAAVIRRSAFLRRISRSLIVDPAARFARRQLRGR